MQALREEVKMKKTIHDYTKADVAGISNEGKVVLRKPNPRYNPHYSGMGERQWEFEMMTFDELEEMKSKVEETLEERIARLRSDGAREKTPDVYFLEHNQAHLDRILKEAHDAIERKTAYQRTYCDTKEHNAKRARVYLASMHDIAFEMMLDQMNTETMLEAYVEPEELQKVLALSAGCDRN